MARSKIQDFDQYRYGLRGVLKPGDRFRVQGGPVYVTALGVKIPMYERGVLVFRKLCIRGSAKWIEAYRANGGGFVLLWVGKSSRSPTIPNLRRRPYRITGKVRSSSQAKNTKRRVNRKQKEEHHASPK